MKAKPGRGDERGFARQAHMIQKSTMYVLRTLHVGVSTLDISLCALEKSFLSD